MLELNKIYNMDCLEGMKQMPDESVDLVIADPPYNVGIDDWDKWLKKDFDKWLSWCVDWASECCRILKDNGSFYVFGDARNIAYIQVAFDKLQWGFINHIVWYKPNNRAIKNAHRLRSFAPTKEHILFYGKDITPFDYDHTGIYSPIRNYLEEERQRTGLTQHEVNLIVGTSSMAGRHYFSKSQWCFPIEEHYRRMQLGFNAFFKGLATPEEMNKLSNTELINLLQGGGDREVLRKDWEELRKDWEELRKDWEVLRRPFTPTTDNWDVWINNIIASPENFTEHPTQKPRAIAKKIILSSSMQGDTVFIPFGGTGTETVVAKELNRNFIGFEISKEYCDIAEKRLRRTQPLPPEVLKAKPTKIETFI